MEARGELRRLADAFGEGEVEKASLQLRSAVDSCNRTLRTLDYFLHDNQQLSKLVQELPTKVSYPVMVPFGKAAFFPGKLVHTNEFLVLLGEGYYAECSASKALEILGRRGKLLGSQIAGVKSQLADLDAETQFFNETFAEAAAGCVEIREEFLESSLHGSVGTLEPKLPGYGGENLKSKIEERLAESKEVVLTYDDKEHELLMARLDEIEAAEAAAEMDLSYKKKNSTDFNSTSAEFHFSDQEHGHSLTDFGCKPSKREPDKHSQGVVDSDHHGVEELAKLCGGIESHPNLRSPGDLVKFEEWRRSNSRKGNTNQITEMKKKRSILLPMEQKVQEPVDNIKSLDQVAPVLQMEQKGATKPFIADKVFTGSVIERTGSTPSTELSQAARQSQPRPTSKFKTRQADK